MITPRTCSLAMFLILAFPMYSLASSPVGHKTHMRRAHAHHAVPAMPQRAQDAIDLLSGEVTHLKQEALMGIAIMVFLLVAWVCHEQKLERKAAESQSAYEADRRRSILALQAKDDEISRANRLIFSIQRERDGWKHKAEHAAREAQKYAAQVQFTPEQLQRMLSDTSRS